MAFQDAWTLDLDRLRQCHIHVVAPDRRVIPFCAYNLTERRRPCALPGAGRRPRGGRVTAATLDGWMAGAHGARARR